MKHILLSMMLVLTAFVNLQAQTDASAAPKQIKHYSDAECIVASTFVPGLGQMLKHHYTEGSLMLISEVALVGASVFPFIISREQLKTIQDPNASYEQFTAAKKEYNTQRIVSYTLLGTAAALHVFNMVRAYTLKDNTVQYAVYPTAIPTNTDYAMGVGLTLKF